MCYVCDKTLPLYATALCKSHNDILLKCYYNVDHAHPIYNRAIFQAFLYDFGVKRSEINKAAAD